MNERKPTTITWRIKNFSFCWQKDEKELSGPTFSIEGFEGSKWTLFLFPRASRSKLEGSIACYLYRESEENSSHEVEIDCELSALGNDGLPLETVLFTKCEMQGTDWSSPLLLRKKTVFLDKRDAFLPEDTLAIRCRIWHGNRENFNSERYFATTRIEVEKSLHYGVVKKTDNWRVSERKYYVIFISSSREPLLVSMSVKVTEEGQTYVELTQSESLKLCKWKLRFTQDTGEEVAHGEDEFLFHSDRIGVCLFTDRMIPLTFTEIGATPHENDYNPYLYILDNLNLQCEIAYTKGIVTQYIEKVAYSINTFQNGSRLKEKRQEYLPTLKNDMLSLMANAVDCDVKLQTTNKIFSAHAIILRARSLFFKNKIDQNKKGRIIRVKDLDNETLHQMLVFLYTDTIENLEPENAIKLYIASEQYGIPSLKHRCSCFLQNNLNISICCEALQTADRCQDRDLKKVAQKYILEHADEVIGSNKWKSLERFTQIVEEILHLKKMKN